MLNTIDDFLKETRVKFMRIDGSTPIEQRNKNVIAFQNDDSIKAALLSITACATGLTLTAASNVIFSEMYYTPSTMIQAEDRAHRIGQEQNCVNIHYLYGEGTCDTLIYRLLMDKFAICESTLDNTNQGMNLEVFKKNRGSIGAGIQREKKSYEEVVIKEIKNSKNMSLKDFLVPKSIGNPDLKIETPKKNNCNIDEDLIEMILEEDSKMKVDVEEEVKSI